jgi:hypothetical protein
LGPDASELLKLTSNSPELTQGADALSMEHLPGKCREIESLNGPCVGFRMMGHMQLLSFIGGSARISQPSVPGSFLPAIDYYTLTQRTLPTQS